MAEDAAFTADLEAELGAELGAEIGAGHLGEEDATAVPAAAETIPGRSARVRARYTVKGAGETVRSFDVTIPGDRLDTLGTELEIFLLYDLVFAQINASGEVMMSHAEILPDAA